MLGPFTGGIGILIRELLRALVKRTKNQIAGITEIGNGHLKALCLLCANFLFKLKNTLEKIDVLENSPRLVL
jgi:hypothetical protein